MSEPLDTAIRNFEREFADIFGHRVSTKHAYRLVRGVISDIREPSEAMLNATQPSMSGVGLLHGMSLKWENNEPPLKHAWRLMIDNLIKS